MTSELPKDTEGCVDILRGKNLVPQSVLHHIYTHHAPHHYGRFRSVVPLTESEKHSMLQLDTVCTDAWLRRLMPEKLETDDQARRKGLREHAHLPRACERNYFSVNFGWKNAVLVRSKDGTVSAPTLALRANLKARGRNHFDAFDRGVRVMTQVGELVLVTTPRAIAFCNVNAISKADQAILDCKDKIREGLDDTRKNSTRTPSDDVSTTTTSTPSATSAPTGRRRRKRRRTLTKQNKSSGVVAVVNLAALKSNRRGTGVGRGSSIAHMFGYRKESAADAAPAAVATPCVEPVSTDCVA